MPLSELWRLGAGNLESGQQMPCPDDPSLPAENDLVELVWENGQITMQNQSSRCSGSPALNGLPPNTSRLRNSVPNNTARIGKFGGVESILDDMSSVVPSGELDLGQDDEMVPWLNYPIGDALPQDYVSDLLPEISGVTSNPLSAQNSFVSMDKRSGTCDGSTSKPSSKPRLMNSWPAQHRQAMDALVSGVSNTTSIGNTNGHLGAVFGNAPKGKDTAKELGNSDMVRPNIEFPTRNSNVMNFPYFSRPATVVKANIPNSEGIPSLTTPSVGRTEVKLINQSNSMQNSVDVRGASSSSKAAENLRKEPPIKNDMTIVSANVANPMKGMVDGDRNVEPMVVSSSVGSGNSAEEQTHNSSKRKFHEVEESECRSADVDTVSIGVTKLACARGGNSSKRSRAAEVHNLSERRRRDRINEKMRALQELIPNCNKVDKASMLDEAIEYLKTLQLQVQIMSMGAGLYIPPPMMFTAMRPPHVPHFSSMGVGMGMGMGLGFGMSMPDANGASPSCPIFSVPPMHFPSPGPTNFMRIPGPSVPVYGHPRHSSVLHTPLAPVTGQPPVTTSATCITAGSSGKHNNKSNEAKNEVLDQSATGQEDKSVSNAPASSPLTSAAETRTIGGTD